MQRSVPSLIHGGFYVATGLIVAVGVALLAGASERSRGLWVLGLGSAIVLGAADVIFVAQRRIARCTSWTRLPRPGSPRCGLAPSDGRGHWGLW